MNDSVGLIGNGVEVSGEINFEGTLRVEGQVSGAIHGITGTVSIGESGFVKADISTKLCKVDGVLEGNLIAVNRVEIGKTGKIVGNITTKEIKIAEGGILEGNLNMNQDASLPPEEALTLKAADINAI